MDIGFHHNSQRLHPFQGFRTRVRFYLGIRKTPTVLTVQIQGYRRLLCRYIARIHKLIAVLFLAVAVTGCDFVDDFSEMMDTKEQAQNWVKENYGWDSQVGFNYVNGSLADLTLVLSADAVGDKTAAELEKITGELVMQFFESQPEVIYIQIVSIPEAL